MIAPRGCLSSHTVPTGRLSPQTVLAMGKGALSPNFKLIWFFLQISRSFSERTIKRLISCYNMFLNSIKTFCRNRLFVGVLNLD